MRVAVIGAGASGLMASLFASKSNDVVVLTEIVMLEKIITYW